MCFVSVTPSKIKSSKVEVISIDFLSISFLSFNGFSFSRVLVSVAGTGRSWPYFILRNDGCEHDPNAWTSRRLFPSAVENSLLLCRSSPSSDFPCAVASCGGVDEMLSQRRNQSWLTSFARSMAIAFPENTEFLRSFEASGTQTPSALRPREKGTPAAPTTKMT